MNAPRLEWRTAAGIMALSALLALPGGPARAEAEPTPPGPEAAAANEPEASVHEEIVVTATRGERRADELPVSATVIDAPAIAATPTGHVDELLRQVPGIQLPTAPASVGVTTPP